MGEVRDPSPAPDLAAAPAIGLPSVQAVSAARYWTLVSSHALVDVFPVMLATLLWPLRERLSLTDWQVNFVLMATPIFSGMTQPILARLTDKHDTRLCGPLGLAIAAVCIGSIGFAQNFWQLAVLQVIGVIAVGMYHPIGVAVAGQVGTQLFRNGRVQAIGIFIFSGMVGHAAGAKAGPAINALNGGEGMPYLAWFIPPALIMAIALHIATRHVKHRHENHAELHAAFAPGESARRWWVIGVLLAQNALRFTVNVGLLVILFNVWPKSKLVQSGEYAPAAFASIEEMERALATDSATYVGNLGAALTVGMGICAILAGRLVKRGREWGPFLHFSIFGAAFVALFPVVGDAMHARGGFGFWWMLPAYACAALTAVGFFAMFPVAVSLGQRLQPGHTSLVTSLLMGVGWGISALSTPLAILFFGGASISLAPTLEPGQIAMAFYGFAALLVISGLLTLAIPRDLVAKAAEAH